MQPRRADHRRRAPGPLRSIPQRIRRLFARLFARRLRFVRKGLNIHVVLDSGAQAPAAAAPDPARRSAHASDAVDPVAAELRQIGIELRRRLDRHALSRAVFDKLAIVERELSRHGYPALHALPIELLHAALEQLGCVVGPRPGELGTLRAKILDAILARRAKAGAFASNLALSTFDVPDKLRVHEAGESEFLRAQQEFGP